MPVWHKTMWTDSLQTLKELDLLPLDVSASPVQDSRNNDSGDLGNLQDAPIEEKMTVVRDFNATLYDVKESKKAVRKREIQAHYRARQRAKQEHLRERYKSMVAALDQARAELVKVREENYLLESLLSVRDGAIGALFMAQQYQSSPTKTKLEVKPYTVAGGRVSAMGSLNHCTAKDCFHILNDPQSGCLTHEFWNFPEDDALDMAIRKESPEVYVAKWKAHAQDISRLMQELETGEREIGANLGDVNINSQHRCQNGQMGNNLQLFTVREVVWQLFGRAREQIARSMTALRVNLPAVQALLSTAQDIEYGEGGKDAFWRDVFEDAKITLAQKQAMADAWHKYSRSLSALQRRKAQIMKELKLTVCPCPYSLSLQDSMSQYIAAYEATQKLAGCEKEEMFLMLTAFWATGKAWSMRQKGKLIARCSPWYPDVVEIMRVAAEDVETR